MIKKDSVFEVKVGPLPSDMYEYEYIVDGVTALEPFKQTWDKRWRVDSESANDSWRSRQYLYDAQAGFLMGN
jgi:hypothetical protein